MVPAHSTGSIGISCTATEIGWKRTNALVVSMPIGTVWARNASRNISKALRPFSTPSRQQSLAGRALHNPNPKGRSCHLIPDMAQITDSSGDISGDVHLRIRSA